MPSKEIFLNERRGNPSRKKKKKMEKRNAYRDLVKDLHPKYVQSLPIELEGLVGKFSSAPLLGQLAQAAAAMWALLGWHNRVGVLKIDKRVHPSSSRVIYTTEGGERVKLFHSEILSKPLPTQLGVDVSIAEVLMWTDSEFPLTLDRPLQCLNPMGLNAVDEKAEGALMFYPLLLCEMQKEMAQVEKEEEEASYIEIKQLILDKYEELLLLSPSELLNEKGVDLGELAMAKAVSQGYVSPEIWEHFSYLLPEREPEPEPEPKFETSPFVGFKNNLKA